MLKASLRTGSSAFLLLSVLGEGWLAFSTEKYCKLPCVKNSEGPRETNTKQCLNYLRNHHGSEARENGLWGARWARKENGWC